LLLFAFGVVDWAFNLCIKRMALAGFLTVLGITNHHPFASNLPCPHCLIPIVDHVRWVDCDGKVTKFAVAFFTANTHQYLVAILELCDRQISVRAGQKLVRGTMRISGTRRLP
jgi:hypothetical protein